jgi:hypothetical protein
MTTRVQRLPRLCASSATSINAPTMIWKPVCVRNYYEPYRSSDLSVAACRIIDRLAMSIAEVERVWRGLRKKLDHIQHGKREWLRKTEVRRFIEMSADQMTLERTELVPLAARVFSR